MRFGVRERYGLVLAGALVALFVTIALPDDDASGVVVLALQGLLLVLTLLAAPPRTGGRTARVAAVIAVLVAITGALLDAVPTWLVLLASATFLVASIATLARGALSLLENGGVTPPVIAAALAIYVLIGLLFATLIGAIADATTLPYFAQHTDGSPASRVYYSFTTLTTTGYGDLTPALSVGRAIAVGEMLIGQIYLVTIVALLIGNVRRRPTTDKILGSNEPGAPG